MNNLRCFFLSITILLSVSAHALYSHVGTDTQYYTATIEELKHMRENTEKKILEAQAKGDLKMLAYYADMGCELMKAIGFYSKAIEYGEVSQLAYEKLLQTPQGKADPTLLYDYAMAMFNMAEVSNILTVNPKESYNLYTKTNELLKQWVNKTDLNKVKNPEIMTRWKHVNITTSQILYYMQMVVHNYAGAETCLDEMVKYISQCYASNPRTNMEYALALQLYADIYMKTEDWEHAMQYWKQSLEVTQKVIGSDNRVCAFIYQRLGEVYYRLNDFKSAFAYAEKGYNIYNSKWLHFANMADLCDMYGMLFFSAARFDQSEELLNLGYKFHKMSNGEKSFPALANRGLSCYPLWYKNEKKKAMKRLEDVMDNPTFYKNLSGDHLLTACAFYYEMQRTLKNYKYIYQNAQRMDELLPKMDNPSPSTLREYYVTIGRAYQDNNKYIEACPFYDKVLNLQRKMARTNFPFLSEEQRSKYWRSTRTYHASILAQNTATTVGSNAVGALLYDAALLQKGMLLEASINLARIVEQKGSPQLKQKMNKLHLMMQSALTPEKQQECQRLETEVQNEARKYGDFLNYTNAVWQDVKKQLAPNEVAVEFVCSEIGDTHCYSAEVLRGDMTQPYHLPLFTTTTKNELTKGSENGQFNDFARTNVWSVVLRKLFKPGDHIYFAPAGDLHLLPIEYMPLTDGKRMDEMYHMHRVSSTRELLHKQSRRTTFKTIALFGGCNYNTTNEDFELLAMASNTRGRAKQSVRNKRTPNLQLWPYLPGTLKEVEGIARIMQASRHQVQLNTHSQSSEQKFRALSESHTGIIHVATHGFYTATSAADDLTQSGLIFAGGNNQWLKRDAKTPSTATDGIMTADEIAHLNLMGTSMVVLSACQTGLGNITGEGVFGLQRSFKKAGVQSLLMSLWEVDDEATQLLMTAFYRHYTTGASKQEALQRAQQEVRQRTFSRNGTTLQGTDPYFWAAFVLIDE